MVISETGIFVEWRAPYIHTIPNSYSADTKNSPIWYERQRHRTGTSLSHTPNIMPEDMGQRVWFSKSQSLLLNIVHYIVLYFRLNGLQSSFLRIHFIYGSNTLHKVWHRTYPICNAPLSRSARRSFSLLQKSLRNHR